MKQIFTFLLAMSIVFAVQAQYIYNDFDANQNVAFVGGAPDPTIIANPHSGGINTSPNVAEWIRGGWEWSHAKAPLDGFIDFTTGTTFTLKAYSPINTTVLFKLEGNIGPVEVSQPITAGSWQELSFDFPSAPNDAYNAIVIFFDIATFNSDTYYFDDVEGPNISTPPVPTLTLPVTFDDPDAEYDLIDFGGALSEITVDPEDAGNNVAKTIKTETAEFWAGTTVGGTLGFVNPIPFTVDSTLMGVVVWSPDEGIPVRLKVEDASNAGITCETEAITTIAMAWDTLIFDFGNPVPATPALDVNNTYNKASIFFNFGTTGADAGEQTYYWDYMYFAGAPEPKPISELDVQDNFENDGWSTIDYWIFQNPGMDTLIPTVDPVNPSNTVGDYNRTGAFEWANSQTVLDHRMDLSERNEFELDVYFPSSNDYSGSLTTTAALKLQNSKLGGNAWTTQTEVVLTVSEFDQWVTLLFDFSAVADSINYDQLVIQLGGEGHWDPGQFYFDNLYLKHIPFVTVETPNGGEIIEQNSTFYIEWDYDYWDEDGLVDIELMKDSTEISTLAINVPVSDTLYEWFVDSEHETGTDFRVIITSQTDNSLTDTSDAFFTILEVDGVIANFSADATRIAKGGFVTFTDLSVGDPQSWVWSFEGGTPATFDGQTPPAIVYETAGVFDVTLTVTTGGDQDILTKDDYITVGTPPSVSFEGSDTLILINETVDFTNLSEGDGNTYQWIFEGGNPASSVEESPVGILYETIGDYDVTLIATNEFGSDTLIMTDYITVGTVGVNTNDDELLQVYPNPAHDHISISLPQGFEYDLSIIGLSGQNILSLKNQKGLISLQTSAIQSGVYVLYIRNLQSEKLSYRKIVIN